MKNFSARLDKIEKSHRQVVALVIVDCALSQMGQEERARLLWRESPKYQPEIEVFSLPLPRNEIPNLKRDRVSLVESGGEELREFFMEVANEIT